MQQWLREAGQPSSVGGVISQRFKQSSWPGQNAFDRQTKLDSFLQVTDRLCLTVLFAVQDCKYEIAFGFADGAVFISFEIWLLRS